jgi:hypothetical protein
LHGAEIFYTSKNASKYLESSVFDVGKGWRRPV